ncbi:MAG: TonB-dependent receptor [Bacteroidales bacterium]|nr:TonB-dependent receptor [Bacteroidales bacterium]
MKKLVVILTALLVGTMSFAQNRSTTVKGVVLDSLTRVGEPAAVIEFYQSSDPEKAIAFTTTNEEGQFSHSFTLKGDYCLRFNNLGRKVIQRCFTIGDQEVIDLGEILAQDNVEMLKAGTVTAMRPLVKMEVDKMIYNVADDVDSKTSTVLDMLRKVPMVSVDGQDNITVNGSSSFQVYVDGKPNQMMSQNASMVFKMMPASSVKNIEVVTNPGVRYDAEGVGGVLNITTNREATGGQSVADGFYGTVRGMASTRGYGGGLFTSMQKGKFALSANVNAMNNFNNKSFVDIERIQDTGFTTRSHSETDMRTPMVMGNFSASYEIDTLNLVSATVGLMHFGMSNDGTSSTSMIFPGMDAISYSGVTSSTNTRNSISASADYQHLWADVPGRSFTLSYQFNAAPSVNNTLNTFGGTVIPGMNLTDRKTDGVTGSTDHTVQTDFTTPLGSLFTIATGAKFIYRHNTSDQTDYLWDGSQFVLNPVSSLKYDFYNRIGAAYTELSGNFGAFGVKAGARYEHTWQTYSSIPPLAVGTDGRFDVNYGALVPTASIQWSPTVTQNIGISYNMRISRPGITYLNPYVDTSDPTALSYGNTDLDVERGHNISLVYNFYSPVVMVNATLRHSYTGNGISSYSFYDENNLLNTTYGNIVKSNNTGLNAFLMINPTNKTRIMLNGGVSYNDIRSELLDQMNAGWSYNIMAGVQQTLPWDLRLSANVISMGSNVNLQGTSTGMSMGILGLTKTFFDDRLSLSVNGMLPLTKDLEMHMGSTTTGNGFTTNMDTTIQMRQVTFQVSWTFGKQGNYTTKRARRSIENEDQLNSTTTAESMGTIMQQM